MARLPNVGPDEDFGDERRGVIDQTTLRIYGPDETIPDEAKTADIRVRRVFSTKKPTAQEGHLYWSPCFTSEEAKLYDYDAVMAVQRGLVPPPAPEPVKKVRKKKEPKPVEPKKPKLVESPEIDGPLDKGTSVLPTPFNFKGSTDGEVPTIKDYKVPAAFGDLTQVYDSLGLHKEGRERLEEFRTQCFNSTHFGLFVWAAFKFSLPADFYTYTGFIADSDVLKKQLGNFPKGMNMNKVTESGMICMIRSLGLKHTNTKLPTVVIETTATEVIQKAYEIFLAKLPADFMSTRPTLNPEEVFAYFVYLCVTESDIGNIRAFFAQKYNAAIKDMYPIFSTLACAITKRKKLSATSGCKYLCQAYEVLREAKRVVGPTPKPQTSLPQLTVIMTLGVMTIPDLNLKKFYLPEPAPTPAEGAPPA